MEIREILVSHHSHTDIGYTHEQPVLWELQARYIRQAMDLVEATLDWPEGTQFKWTCEVTAPVLYWLEHAEPAEVERFARHVRAGRIEVMALFCNLTPLYDLEELHRLLLPVARLRRELDIPIRTAMNSDVNGLPWPLVDLLLDSGITGVTMAINEHMGGAPLERPNAFWWVGPSGRRILAYNGLHYGFLQRYGLGEEPVSQAHPRIVEWLESHPVARRSPILYVQNTRLDHWDNNGPQEKLAPFVREWNEAGLTPRLRLVTPAEAIQRLAELPDQLLPEHRGDWHDYWNFGAGSSVEPMRINRRSRRFLYDAGVVAALHGTHEPRDRRLTWEAWLDLMLFDEHTWGSWNSISEPDSEFTRAQWGFKENYSNRAAALSQFVRRRAIANLAARINSDHPSPAVLVYNPYPVPMRRRLRVPTEWKNPDLPTALPNQHGYDVRWRRPAEFFVTEPVDVPALGWRVVELAAVEAKAERAEAAEALQFVWDPQNRVLKTPQYEIRLDADRQGIVSWKESATGRELVDPSAPHRFGQLIYERSTAPNGWHTLFPGKWNPDWPAMRIAGAPASPIEVSREPGCVRLSQRVHIPEFPEITWNLRLYDDQPGITIDIEGRFPDRAMPEALYMCFPLSPGTSDVGTGTAGASEAGPRWKAWYTTAGLRVLYHAEQLPGSCRDYITTDTWAYMEPDGAGFGMQMVCPDNPLLTFGGFHFGKRLMAPPADAPAWIMAWVSNTYWQTNFRAGQPGPFKQRYILIPHEAGAAQSELDAAADRILQEPILHPLPKAQKGVLPAEGRAIALRLGQVRLVAIAPADDGDGVVLRFYNPTAAEQLIEIGPGLLSVKKAWLADPVETRGEELPCTGGSVCLTVPPRSPKSVRLMLEPGASLG